MEHFTYCFGDNDHMPELFRARKPTPSATPVDRAGNPAAPLPLVRP